LNGCVEQKTNLNEILNLVTTNRVEPNWKSWSFTMRRIKV